MIQEMTDYHYRNRSIQVRHEIPIIIFTIIEPELSTKAEENIAHNHTKILPRPQNLPARQTYYLLLNNNNIITNCIFSITDSILTAATDKNCTMIIESRELIINLTNDLSHRNCVSSYASMLQFIRPYHEYRRNPIKEIDVKIPPARKNRADQSRR